MPELSTFKIYNDSKINGKNQIIKCPRDCTLMEDIKKTLQIKAQTDSKINLIKLYL